MRMKRFVMASLLVLFLSLFGSGMAAGQEITDLVFCMDGSSSLGDDGWEAQIEGTAAALLNVIPHNGTVRITIIQFSSNSTTEIGPVLVTAANAADLAQAILDLEHDSQSTNTASCIDQAVMELDGLMPESSTQIIDVSTDGLPFTNGSSQPAYDLALEASQNAIDAGIDQVNALGIMLGTDGEEFLDQLIQPQTGEPGDGFVINIDELEAYEDAIADKVERELELCARLDDYDATCTTDASGQVQVTLTFTNFLTDENGVPFDAEHVWITDPVLVGDPGAVVTVTPNYFPFISDPICSAADPACMDATRTITFTVDGAPDGGTLQFAFELHDEDYEPCCEEIFEIELPDCDCGQVTRERVWCVWSWPFLTPNFFYNFTFQNLYDEVVEEIRLTPIAPPFPSIQFNPNIIDGLSLAPPPIAGSTNNTVQVLGPAAVQGQTVEFLISSHNENGICCSIPREITLPYRCFWRPKPYPYPVDTKEISIRPLELGFEVVGFGRSGHGVKIPVEGAAGVVVNLGVTDATAVEGASLRLEGTGLVQGRESTLGGITVVSSREGTQVAMDSAIGRAGTVELYLGGKQVLGASLDGSNSVTLPGGAWPSSVAVNGRDGAISLALPQGAMVGVGGKAVAADHVVFGVDAFVGVDALTGVTLTADGIEAVAIDAQVYPGDEGR